jgi:hypothetical protein
MKYIFAFLASLILVIPTGAFAITNNNGIPRVETFSYSFTFDSIDAAQCVSNGNNTFSLLWKDDSYNPHVIASSTNLTIPKTLTGTISAGSIPIEVDAGCSNSGGDVQLQQYFEQTTALDPLGFTIGLTRADFSTTTTSTTTACTATGYTGPNFQEWLFVMGIIVFFVSLASWGNITRPIKTLYGRQA